MAIHRYITIFDISIQPKCVSIQYHCLMYHDMTIYRYIVASLNDAVPWLNEAKSQMFRCTVSFKNFEIHLHFICLLPAVRPGCSRCRAPETHNKANLRNCCSEDDLPTAPWRFLLSFIPFLVLLYSFSKV